MRKYVKYYDSDTNVSRHIGRSRWPVAWRKDRRVNAADEFAHVDARARLIVAVAALATARIHHGLNAQLR